MTALPSTAPAPPAAAADSGHRVGFGHLMLSEWTKLRSVRSTLWSLALLFLLTVGFTALLMALTVSQWNKARGGHAEIIADPVSSILGAGNEFGQLAICVLGVLVMTAEYSTGVIRASLLAVPRRIPMLAAKVAVFAVLVFIVGEIVSFVSFFVGAAILHSHVQVALSDPGVTRAVFGEGLYLTVLGLFAMAIGGLVRHTAGGITGVIGFVLVLAPLSQLLPGNYGTYTHAYLPSTAGRLIAQAVAQPGAVLSPWEGFGIFCAWTAALLIGAGYVLYRRDA